MKRLTIALTVAVVAAIGLSGCNRIKVFFAGNEGKPGVDVVLRMQPDPDDGGKSICTVDKTKTGKLGGDSDKNKHITWIIENVDCLIPQYVSADEYRDPPTTSGTIVHDVIDPDHSETPSPISSRTKNVFLKAEIIKQIKKPDPHKVYKYRICWGPAKNPTSPKGCWDPDVDVWPF